MDQQYRAIKASDSLWAKQKILDKQNQEFLKKIIQRYGWPGQKLVDIAVELLILLCQIIILKA